MFNLDQLHRIREEEIQRLTAEFPPPCSVLELGGGTGYQAKYIYDLGFEIESIDIETSRHRRELVFPVTVYDGRTIPFNGDSFDVIFSSNVFEHIKDLETTFAEIRRVMKSGGIVICAMPSSSWRFWTSLTHYIEAAQKFAVAAFKVAPRSLSPRKELQRIRMFPGAMRHLLRYYKIPPVHGERGNTLSELHYFSINWWRRCFEAHNFEVLRSEPMGLFYTGYMIFGTRLSLRWRKHLARVFGSACNLYVVRPRI